MAPESDMAERMARVETKIDFLIGQMSKLPPSPVCVEKHVEFGHLHVQFNNRIATLEKWQNKIIGIFFALNIVLVIAMEKLRLFFFGGSQ